MERTADDLLLLIIEQDMPLDKVGDSLRLYLQSSALDVDRSMAVY